MGNGPLISVIVPTWGDDVDVLRLVRHAQFESHLAEWIVAAVNPSADLELSAREKTIRLVSCKRPSRGSQMNAGAAMATGRLLCFHHADSEWSPEHLKALVSVLSQDEVVGGAFHRRFDQRHPRLRKLEKMTGHLSALGHRFQEIHSGE